MGLSWVQIWYQMTKTSKEISSLGSTLSDPIQLSRAHDQSANGEPSQEPVARRTSGCYAISLGYAKYAKHMILQVFFTGFFTGYCILVCCISLYMIVVYIEFSLLLGPTLERVLKASCDVKDDWKYLCGYVFWRYPLESIGVPSHRVHLNPHKSYTLGSQYTTPIKRYMIYVYIYIYSWNNPGFRVVTYLSMCSPNNKIPPKVPNLQQNALLLHPV